MIKCRYAVTNTRAWSLQNETDGPEGVVTIGTHTQRGVSTAQLAVSMMKLRRTFDGVRARRVVWNRTRIWPRSCRLPRQTEMYVIHTRFGFSVRVRGVTFHTCHRVLLYYSESKRLIRDLRINTRLVRSIPTNRRRTELQKLNRFFGIRDGFELLTNSAHNFVCFISTAAERGLMIAGTRIRTLSLSTLQQHRVQ